MKKYILSLVAVLIVQGLIAQNEGVVIYEESIKLTMDLPPEFAGMVPKERSQKKQLRFTSNESLFKNLPKEENVAEEIASEQGGMVIKFKVTGAENVTYRNLESGVIVEKQELFGRDFRVKGEPKKFKWKVAADQKKIAGYTCIKATHMRNDTIPVTAWFTPQIPVQNGPANYGGLPGLILALDVNNGAHVYRTLDVDLRPLTEDEVIEMPKKGKQISKEEFKKIREEKMKEMEDMGGGNRIMIRHN